MKCSHFQNACDIELRIVECFLGDLLNGRLSLALNVHLQDLLEPLQRIWHAQAQVELENAGKMNLILSTFIYHSAKMFILLQAEQSFELVVEQL